MKKLSIFLICSMVVFQYCTSTKKANKVVPPPPVNYTSNVQPVIVANCSPCHIPPRGNKKPLDSYVAAKMNIDEIISRISLNPNDRGFMPFKHAKLADSIIHVFTQWKTDGLLEK